MEYTDIGWLVGVLVGGIALKCGVFSFMIEIKRLSFDF